MARAAATGDEAATHRAAAVERFQASLAIERRIGNQAGAADTLGELGKLWLDAGQMREAIAAFTEALEICTSGSDNPAKVGIDLEFLGSVHERQGQYAAALEKYQQALELYAQVRLAARCRPSWSGTSRGCGGRWATDRQRMRNG